MARASPVKIAISYAHEDHDFLRDLRTHLTPSERSGKLEIWCDGEIRPGEKWSNEIMRAFASAEIYILLISQHFFSSDFCYDEEFRLATQRTQRNEATILPIIVRDCGWEKTRVGLYEVLPKAADRPKAVRPMERFYAEGEPARNQAWKAIQSEIELKADWLRRAHPTRDIHAPVRELTEHVPQQGARRVERYARVASVRDFWQGRRDLLRDYSGVEIEGTLSQYAPLVVGPPLAKQRLHKEFRRNLKRYVGQQDGEAQAQCNINTCISLTAGQMVIRTVAQDADYLYFGLYNSIVRNSIPVFVARDHFLDRLRPSLDTHERRTFEARVKGRLVEVDNSYITEYIRKYQLGEVFEQPTLNELGRHVLGIAIDQPEHGVAFLGQPRYLDGDIWLAIEDEGLESFHTTFLDISDRSQREMAFRELEEDIYHLFDSPVIISQYDDINELIAQGLDVACGRDAIDRMFRAAFVS